MSKYGDLNQLSKSTEWNNLNEYERKRYSNSIRNWEVLKEIGITPKIPEFLLHKKSGSVKPRPVATQQLNDPPDQQLSHTRMQLRSTDELRKPSRFDDFETSYITDIAEPTTYEKAMKSSSSTKLQQAIDVELNALSKNDTGDIVDEPTDCDIIDNMEEVKRFVQECLPTLTTEDIYLIMETFFYLGVESLEDLQFVEPEKDLSSVLKLVQARKLKRTIDAHFNHQPRETLAQPQVGEIIQSSSSSSSSSVGSPAIELVVKPSSGSLDSESLLEKIPYHKFSEQILLKLERGEVPTPSERREVVRIVVAEIMGYIPSPRKSHLEAIAMEVVRRYPESFKDTIGNESIGLGHGSLLCQLMARVENCRRLMCGPKKRKVDVEGSVPKRFSDSYGCVNHQPNDFPDGEDMQTQKQKLAALKNEFAKVDRNDELVNQYMQETYVSQRLTINSKSSVRKILSDWPFLKERKYLYQHAENLMGFSLREKLEISLKEKLDELENYVKSMGKKNKLLRFIFDLKSQYPPTLFLLNMLSELFDEDLEILLEIYESEESLENIGKMAPSSPYIACIGDPTETNSVCTVFVDKQPLETNVPMNDAFLMWFAAFYVFNLVYPKELCATLEFIQRALFGINPLSRGTKMEKRFGKRVYIHPKVINIINKIKHLSSENTELTTSD